MAVIPLIFAIIVQTSVTKLTPESKINALPETLTAVFTLQTRQIRTTSEATPAASAGNNLHAGALSNEDVQEVDFQAISTIQSFRNTIDKKYDGKNEGNEKLPPPGDENGTGNKEKISVENMKQDKNNAKAMPFVLDSCFETTFSENQVNIIREQSTENINNDLQVKNRKIGSLWSKRNAGVSNSDAMKIWLEKYNNLKNSVKEEKRQLKPETILLKKTTELSTYISSPSTESTLTTVKIIPITREVFKESVEPNTTHNIIVTENNIIASYTEDWVEAKDRTKIRFGGLPQRETYLIPALKLEEGFHPFSFMSEFFYLIYPFDFSVGLIKDIVWGEFTFPYSFLQSIKVESTFLAFTIAFACIALVIPSYLLILGVLSLFSRSGCDDGIETGALFPETEESDCNNRALMVVTLCFVLICCVLISGMAVSNEQAHTAAADAPNVLSCACTDIATWLASAARELHHSLVPPVDLLMHAYQDDLRNIEALLGEPIHQAIGSESGIDLVFDSLTDIITESEDLSTKISSLRDVSTKAGALASAASDRIKDLARQLDSLKKHCTVKDMPLCDTVNTHSLELKMKFDLILHEQQLLQLRTLGVENLSRAIVMARQELRTLPSAIASQTGQVREDILKDVESRGQAIHSSAKILSDIVRHLTAGLRSTARRLQTGVERVHRYEFARWTLMLACIISFGFVMAIILIAMLCGCVGAKNHAKRTLKVSAMWLCVTSFLLWGMVSAIFLIAGHAEVYVCHVLRDSPQYETLAALLDRPSPLLHNNEGIFDALFRELENITIDVSAKDVLRDCEKDMPAYSVFQLEKVLDVNKETSYFEWEELQADLGRLASAIDVGYLRTISVNFSTLLNDMLIVSNVNLAKYRMDYNVPVVGKDLPSLLDQLENVAAQVTDLTTAGRLETLASRTQRLHLTHIRPLEQLRADVVFKLTELELKLMPFRRKLNISLSHIHTAQFYIDNRGDVIAQKKVSTFVSRLTSHAAGWRTHVLVSTAKHAAKCRPLFTVYAAARSLLCTNYIASLHGWWVCGFFLGLLWCAAVTPLCVKLWRSYGKKIRAHETMSLTNLSGPPPRSDSW